MVVLVTVVNGAGGVLGVRVSDANIKFFLFFKKYLKQTTVQLIKLFS